MSEGKSLVSTGIHDISNYKFDVTVIPNPNDGRFRLRFESVNQGKYQIQIMNELGQIQMKKEVYITGNKFEKEFELPSAPKGNYFISILDNINTYTRKIIIQ